MRDRIRWHGRGASLDTTQLVTLVQHVEHWRGGVPGYDLLIPRDRASDTQLYGEMLLLERVGVRGAIPEIAVRLLDALSELTGLLPNVTVTVMTDDVVFAATPMGFERRARAPGDDMPARPEDCVQRGATARVRPHDVSWALRQ
jgi:hypothetical protein